MKTFITATVVLLITTSSFAQLEKGAQFLSGQLGGGVSKTDYATQSPNSTVPAKDRNYNITLSYGYLVADTWAVGLSASAGNQSTDYTNNFSTTNPNYTVSPYARKYFSIGEKFYVHLDGGVRYAASKLTSKVPTQPTQTDKTTTTSVYVSPGLTYFLSNRFALTANLGSLSYGQIDWKSSSPLNDRTRKTFSASFGLTSFSFGASIFF